MASTMSIYQQMSKEDDESIKPRLQDALSSLTLNDQLTRNCQKKKIINNVTDCCHCEKTKNDSNNSDNGENTPENCARQCTMGELSRHNESKNNVKLERHHDINRTVDASKSFAEGRLEEEECTRDQRVNVTSICSNEAILEKRRDQTVDFVGTCSDEDRFETRRDTPDQTVNVISTCSDEDRLEMQRDSPDETIDVCLSEATIETRTYNQTTDCIGQNCFSVDSIICYGLGNFSSCVNARYQLSLLLLLIDYLKILPSRCFCYDPVFTNAEHDILKGYGLSCLEFNEEGKRKVDKPTIFYMPHCGKPLYNNLLWSNWGASLSNVIIIGNSFKNFDERFSSKLLEEEVPYIKAILPFAHELEIVNNFKFLDIFNDIGIHVFPTSSLQQAPSTMWKSVKEPNYSHMDDVEIIVNKS